MKKYRYNINNLDCANCAKRIEDSLNKDKRLNNVIVNFSTSRLSFETDSNISLNEINKLVSLIDDGVTISEDEVKQSKEYNFILLIIGFLFGIVGILFNIQDLVNKVLILISYIILLYKPFINALKMLIKSKTINENLLIVISCVGAYLIGESFEGIVVVSLYLLGKILEEKAINNTRSSVKKLIDLKENFAYKRIDSKNVKVDVESLKVGDVIVVKKGDRAPVDGIIIEGNTLLDSSALTGESDLVEVNVNDNILSGTINKGDIILVKVTSEYKDSTVARILSLLEDATDRKAHIETLVSRISKVYTPLVLVLAILVYLLLPLLFNVNSSESIYRALTFLVISCPCAFAISVPLSYFTGIGVSSKNGILIKGSNYLDGIGRIDKIIFDKTGTLTTGSFTVTNIEIFDDKYSKEEVIEILIKGESNSSHPIALSIMKLSDKKIDNSDVKNYKELSGKGISFSLGKDKILIGNSKICDCDNDCSVHLNINGKHIASITIDDGIKEEAKEVINELRKNNILTYMFTGDKKSNALEIAKRLNIDSVEYEMLPTDKYSKYEKIKKHNELVAFVGDGINDAPTLKRADIGISMGNIGSSSAIEASDIVLIKDDLSKILQVIKIAKYTNKIIKENLLFAILVKVIILILSVFGLANMWFAVFADTGVTVITILNTLRIMNRFKGNK